MCCTIHPIYICYLYVCTYICWYMCMYINNHVYLWKWWNMWSDLAAVCVYVYVCVYTWGLFLFHQPHYELKEFSVSPWALWPALDNSVLSVVLTLYIAHHCQHVGEEGEQGWHLLLLAPTLVTNVTSRCLPQFTLCCQCWSLA